MPPSSDGPLAETFWIPAPPGQRHLARHGMTTAEANVLKRLRRGRRIVPGTGPGPSLRDRLARRRGRRLLEQLEIGDLKNLAQIVMRLGL